MEYPVSIINLVVTIVVFVIAYVVGKWLVTLAAAEWAPSMPGGVITALAVLFALVFSGVAYVRGPTIWSRA